MNDNIPVRSIRNIFFRMVNPGEVVLHHATQTLERAYGIRPVTESKFFLESTLKPQSAV